MKLVVRGTCERTNDKNESKNFSFYISYEEQLITPFKLWSCDMTYQNAKYLASGRTSDQFILMLEKMGLSNIELFFKDREHLERWKWANKDAAFIHTTTQKSEIEAFEEELEEAKLRINNKNQ